MKSGGGRNPRPETYMVGVEDDGIYIGRYDVRHEIALSKCEQLQDALFEEKRHSRRQARLMVLGMAAMFWIGLAGGYLLRPLVRGGVDYLALPQVSSEVRGGGSSAPDFSKRGN